MAFQFSAEESMIIEHVDVSRTPTWDSISDSTFKDKLRYTPRRQEGCTHLVIILIFQENADPHWRWPLGHFAVALYSGILQL